MGSEQCVPSPPAPQVVTDPEDQTVTSGQSVALTAAATGSQNPTVQWLSGANGSHDYVHAGSTAVVQTTTGPRSPGCRSVRTRTPTPLRATSAPLTGLPRGQWRLRRRQERHRHAGIGADEHRFRRHHSLRHVDTAGSHLFHPRHHQLRGECRRRRCDGDIHDPGLTFRPEREEGLLQEPEPTCRPAAPPDDPAPAGHGIVVGVPVPSLDQLGRLRPVGRGIRPEGSPT